MEPIKYLKDMLGVTEGTIVDTAIDIGLSAAPTIGQMYQSYQIKKLEKRMNAHESHFQVIKDKIEKKENDVFYKQEVFPLIVKQLMNEDQDEKAKVIIDGFEYVIDNDLNEIERIYHYYDVLSELRYSDILMLIEDYMPYEMRKNLTLNIKLPTEEELRSSEYQEGETIKTYQKNKMVRLGLLENRVVNVDGGDFNDEGKMSLIEEKIVITPFGINFLIFFGLEDTEEEQD
ncbi:hypothetical protein [Cytobacillus oceanisediminis]|uniref:hypothetical protein n=1 Tax=Cytobacillus oceanisediminis TaxID=665099 RepID=UPI001C21BAFB|nr:hypothetical protein [Cytobacillus oceanisediminis]MBU8772020.1 hypothetical protein [Cytobacillus oceanisediminis]